MTKMVIIPINGKKKKKINKNKSLCPVTILVDSQVSDRCPSATCYLNLHTGLTIHVHQFAVFMTGIFTIFLQNQKAYDFETWHEASGNGALQS